MDVVLFDWPFLALAGGLLGWMVLLLMPWRAGSRWRDPRWLPCAFLPTYMLHQFEEHGFDLLGRRYHFIVEMCGNIGHADLSMCPADRAFILAVNVGAVWLAGGLAIAFARKNPFVGTCTFGVCLVNGIAHIADSIMHGGYTSGVLSSRATPEMQELHRALLSEDGTAVSGLDVPTGAAVVDRMYIPALGGALVGGSRLVDRFVDEIRDPTADGAVSLMDERSHRLCSDPPPAARYR